MKGSSMKWRLSAAAFALCIASLYVNAQVGQKPFPKIDGGSGSDPPPPRIFSIPPVVPSAQPCAAEIDRALASAKIAFGGQHTSSSRTYYDENVKSWSSASCASLNLQAMVAQADVRLANATERLERAKRAAPNSQSVLEEQSTVDLFAFSACMVRAGASLCKASVAPPPSNASPGPNRPVPTSPVPPPSAADNSAADVQRLTKERRDAMVLAERRQADLDYVRAGKPKLHNGGSVAHHCLKPQPGGGMLNDCPYAVEYHYCVFRPKKDSWSEGFDCEKKLGGVWHVGPGPGTPALIHMGGEITYWFACRYGESVQKPDGIAAVDIEFQLGRGLLGRCAEWGSKRG